MALMKMARGVFVFGRVATADVAAREAQTQMHPIIAGAQTIFATVGARRDLSDLIKMQTLLSHSILPFSADQEPRADGAGRGHTSGH